MTLIDCNGDVWYRAENGLYENAIHGYLSYDKIVKNYGVRGDTCR